MQQHLQQISRTTPEGEHAVVVMDRAAWHKSEMKRLPDRVSILLLPAASPELNPMEQVWQWLKQHSLSNRVFTCYEEIVKACCTAWNKFASDVSLITSICEREWAQVFSY